MKITKYEHACLTIEKDKQVIVIDPGNFSTDFISPAGVVAIVVTHAHPDHFDHDQIAAIVDKNPGAAIIGHLAVVASIEVFETRSVQAGDALTVGPFNLKFFGGTHAIIHESIPSVTNLGVMINELLYYPGDSFVLPEKSVDTLAVPASAPWMKIGEAMDFLIAIKPRLAFPTHDALLSNEGKAIADRLLGMAAEANDIEYRRLETSTDV